MSVDWCSKHFAFRYCQCEYMNLLIVPVLKEKVGALEEKRVNCPVLKEKDGAREEKGVNCSRAREKRQGAGTKKI
jgi:hypothetical protein